MYRGRNVYKSEEDAVVWVRPPALQMKEHCAMARIRFMWAPETCCQIRPGARSLGSVSKCFCPFGLCFRVRRAFGTQKLHNRTSTVPRGLSHLRPTAHSATLHLSLIHI